ncbi:TIGR02300 family protein [Siculibacillus lacustris]|uniref:TIGR02300 family protein n=1 Tax=Siculibacillus lacustris TaxID=1549641 RepID=A0A4Q9VVH0_9HYPH|nr:TIGR02300 family protein [Siculibacillus lacustris]TBW39188.1 TIGR02300 family protein [Siculibacillus lacustris]
MVKPELGTKRLCPNCGTKYYDLDRDPILCPKCGTAFTAAAVQLRAKAVAPVEEDEVEVEEAPAVDFVSLEEADAEVAGGEEVPEIEDEEIADIEVPDDDTFLEPEDDDEDIDGIDIDVAGEDEER